MNKNNKLIGYYQWGQKVQPNRLPSSTNSYTDLAGTLKQISGSWIYKGEWNSTLNNKTYVEARYGVFGYYFPLLANSDTTQHEKFDNQLTLLTGADQKEQTDRQRKQLTGAMTYFQDGWGGTHNFKVGGELLLEDRLVRLYAGRLGQRPRDDCQQRQPVAGAALRADCAVGGQPGRRPERQPAEHRQGQHDRRVPHRSVDRSAARRATSASASTTTTCSRRISQQLAYTFPSGARASAGATFRETALL
jgi:hypothetical protein